MDFNSALARLLREGALRDAFRIDSCGVLTGFALTPRDEQALAGLRYEDLEVQADILLRKRFDAVKRLVPQTCEGAGWERFRVYARQCWPETPVADAAAFCEESGCPVPSERNRARFLAGRARGACFWLRRGGGEPSRLQIFLRWGKGWREWNFEVRF